MRLLSASRLNKFLGCAHQAALWLEGVPLDAMVDETLELIRRKGFAHEEEILARLEGQFGKPARIDQADSLLTRGAATLAAMKRGEPLIYQGALANNRWRHHYRVRWSDRVACLGIRCLDESFKAERRRAGLGGSELEGPTRNVADPQRPHKLEAGQRHCQSKLA